jgi:hypothetical protein
MPVGSQTPCTGNKKRQTTLMCRIFLPCALVALFPAVRVVGSCPGEKPPRTYIIPSDEERERLKMLKGQFCEIETHNVAIR